MVILVFKNSCFTFVCRTSFLLAVWNYFCQFVAAGWFITDVRSFGCLVYKWLVRCTNVTPSTMSNNKKLTLLTSSHFEILLERANPLLPKAWVHLILTSCNLWENNCFHPYYVITWEQTQNPIFDTKVLALVTYISYILFLYFICSETVT